MINLYINERRAGDVTILDLKGRTRIVGGTVSLHRSIRCLANEGKLKIVLNLASVTHIDSSGLGELIASSVTLGSHNGELKLAQVTDSLRDLLISTKVATVLEVFEEEQAALSSFAAESWAPRTLLNEKVA